MASFDHLTRALMDCLSAPEYGLAEEDFSRLNRLSNAKVHYVSGETSISLEVRSESDERIGTIQTSGTPKVIDIVPFCAGDTLQLVRPLVLLYGKTDAVDENLKTYITLHEICHLFSIGDYRKVSCGTANDGAVYEHSFGLKTYSYKTESDRLICVQSHTDERANERMNEFVTRYFAELLLPEEIVKSWKETEAERSSSNRVLSVCRQLKLSVPSLIGSYFTGNLHSFYDYFASPTSCFPSAVS